MSEQKSLARWCCRSTTAIAAILACSCATTRVSNLQRYEFTRAEMGLPFRIVLYAASPNVASNAATAAFNRIHQLNDVLSDYDSDSELSRLSRTSGSGRNVKLSDDLWRVLFRAQEISRLSGGAFDVTVGPLVNLWRKARREKALPDPAALAEARSRVGYTNIVLNRDQQTARLLLPDMRLDVGGIGKGYALDEALRVLDRERTPRALVTGGGDMAAGDPPPGKKGWRIELPPLDVTNAPPARFVLLKRTGLATSGDLFQRLEIAGKRYSHIVDPRTGLGLTDHSLVTIIARDATTADAFSKVVSVLGPAKSFPILRREKIVARVCRKPADQIEEFQTPGFPVFLDRAEDH